MLNPTPADQMVDRPDDVFFIAKPGAIQETWPLLEPYLGHRKEFWSDLFELLKELEFVRR